MYKVIEFNLEENYIKDFLGLPKKLYSKKEYVQNYSLEEDVLEEKHVLNKYFKQKKYLVYLNEKLISRCIVTIYEDSKAAFIGYFESFNDKEAVKNLLDRIEEDLKKMNIFEIVGPVDSSFWNGYRLKLDNFDKKPYFGEPYNKEYYKDLLENNGFKMFKKWSSNFYNYVETMDEKDRKMYKKRLNRAIDMGYKFINPKKEEFDAFLEIIYELFIELYKDFHTFHYIDLKDFKEIFSSFFYLIDYKLIDIVYFEDEVVAFSLTFPDFGNEIYKNMNFYRKLKILSRTNKSKRYVNLYMGVKKGHLGLARALAQRTIDMMSKKKADLIGALIEENKITGGIGSGQIKEKKYYALFKKEFKE